jgi:uncharacterized protein
VSACTAEDKFAAVLAIVAKQGYAGDVLSAGRTCRSAYFSPELWKRLAPVPCGKYKKGSFVAAVATYNEQRAVWLLEHAEVDTTERGVRGQTMLNLAAEYGLVGLVKAMIDRKAVPLDAGDSKGYTALHEAASSREQAKGIEIAKMLLAQVPSLIHAKNERGSQPLHLACCMEREEMVGFLVEQVGVEVNSPDGAGDTPIILACQQGNLPICEALVAKGATVAPPGGQALCAAAEYSLPLVKFLIEKGLVASPPSAATLRGGRNALHAACFGDKADVVEYLLSLGCFDVNATDGTHEETPLHKCCSRGSVAAAKVLLAHGGVDVNVRTRMAGTPLKLLRKSRPYNGMEEMEALLAQHGATE